MSSQVENDDDDHHHYEERTHRILINAMSALDSPPPSPVPRGALRKRASASDRTQPNKLRQSTISFARSTKKLTIVSDPELEDTDGDIPPWGASGRDRA